MAGMWFISYILNKRTHINNNGGNVFFVYLTSLLISLIITYIELNLRKISESERMWENGRGLIKVLLQQFPEGTEDDHEKL